LIRDGKQNPLIDQFINPKFKRVLKPVNPVGYLFADGGFHKFCREITDQTATIQDSISVESPNIP
jgi:hypothetical protein